jgi:putative tryptophan/tyrosine transport system substrate-binding protein
MEVRGREDLDVAFQTSVRARAQAVIMVQSAIYFRHTVTLASIALPANDDRRDGLRAGRWPHEHGPNIRDSWRRAAGYVDKILKGA